MADDSCEVLVPNSWRPRRRDYHDDLERDRPFAQKSDRGSSGPVRRTWRSDEEAGPTYLLRHLLELENDVEQRTCKRKNDANDERDA